MKKGANCASCLSGRSRQPKDINQLLIKRMEEKKVDIHIHFFFILLIHFGLYGDRFYFFHLYFSFKCAIAA